MSNDRHYVPGDNYILDDLSGFKIRTSEARMIPGGQTGQLWVAPERWEPQQPQDFVQGVRDDETVAVSRPRQVNQFTILGTYVIAPSPRGSATITVDSAVGFQTGMPVQIMLDTGVNFEAVVVNTAGNQLNIDLPIPASVGTMFGAPIENAVISLSGFNAPAAGPFVLNVPGSDILNFNVLG